MDVQTRRTPAVPDGHQLMQAAGASSELGKNLHILIRSAIPGSVSVRGVDETAWEVLKSEIRNSLNWLDEHNITIREYDHAGKAVCFDSLHLECGITVFGMPHRRSVTLYYDHHSDRRALADLTGKLESARAKEPASRIGYLMLDMGRLFVKHMEYRPYERDLTCFMGSDAGLLRACMVTELNTRHLSGLYLLHGSPGTGKTSFIKSVIGEVDKNVLFLTPALTASLTSPSLIGLLMENPDSVVIIEDAETVLMKREADNSNAVANLLNLTDGFPADFLNLKIICTFNTKTNDIDPALLRMGRLRAIHEFKRLSCGQARELAAYLGMEIEISRPMTLAEVCHAGKGVSEVKGEGIGF